MTLTANWLTFLAAFALIGAGGARVLFARLEASDAGSDAWTDSDRLARRIGSSAAVILLIAAAFRLLAQAESFLDPGEVLSPAAVKAVLSTGWGRGWWIQVASAVVAFLVSLGPPSFAIAGALLVSFTLPLTGHAMDAPNGPIVGVTLHGLHAFAGGLWLGTLAVSLFTWHRSIHRSAPGTATGDRGSSGSSRPWRCIGVRARRLRHRRGTLAGRQPKRAPRNGVRPAAAAEAGASSWCCSGSGPTTGGSCARCWAAGGRAGRLLRASLIELTVAVLILGVTASLVALPAGE